jgi:Flp pilus assembly protein TadD
MSKAHYLLGKALLKKGFLGPAEDALRESVRINDNFAESHLLLAETLEQLGHCNQAAVEYERALALQRSLAEAKDRLVVLASESGRKA